MTASATTHTGEQAPAWRGRAARWLHWLLLAVAAVFFVVHWLHLTADFPNHSPWSDWSKYTDEGWYGDAAIRHYLSGHWYFAGDFNPAVALPVWPALELVLFRFTGVSLAAARGLTLGVFGATLVIVYALISRHTRPRSESSGPPLAAALTVLLLCVSPFLYVFEREAILEPLLIALTALAMLVASYLHPLRRGRMLRDALPMVALAVLLPAIILTKTTGVFLLPAVFYMVWARAGYRLGPALRLAVTPAVMGGLLWCAYFFLFVRPHYLEDYQYLFSANAYTGVALEPLAKVVLNTLADGMWIGAVLYPAAFVALALALFWRPRLFRNPLVPALLLWMGGYFFFLAYHNNLQPRYYMVVAVPLTAFVALALDNFRQPDSQHPVLTAVAAVCVGAVVLGIAVPDAVEQISFALHPTYEFEAAAQQVKQIVMNEPGHPRLILSISGSDITLMTGLPSIDDDFGTLDLGERVRQYRPGWYIAWNELDDDKAEAITPLYTLTRVAAIPALDDPDRNLLIVYRLDPNEEGAAPGTHKARRRTPKALVTKMGQQPSVPQLQH
jgi:hypothetical protein